MEYLAEAGALFYGPDVFAHSQSPENESGSESESTNSWWSTIYSAQPTPPAAPINPRGSTEDSSSSIGGSGLAHAERKRRKKLISLGDSSVIARWIVRKFQNGDRFSGYADGITGEVINGTKEYNASGDIYEGPFQKGERHGNDAVCKMADGSKFIGSYRYDKPVNGTLITQRFTYHGSFLRTTPESFILHGDNCRLAYENNDVYEGEFRYGVYHGYGKESNSLYEYSGEYKEGKRHGTGTLVAHVRNIYPELFKDGNMSYTYTGNWVEGLMEGSANETLLWHSEKEDISSSFTGNFHQNRRNGSGKLSLFDGTVVEGSWRWGKPIDVNNDKQFTSKWRMTYVNGDVYDGKCYNRKKENTSGSDGFDNLWRQGAPDLTPHGDGTLFYAYSNDVYCGQFNMGERHGSGMYIDQEKGEEYDGMWRYDEPIGIEEDHFTVFDPYKPVLDCRRRRKSFLRDLPYAGVEEETELLTLEETISSLNFGTSQSVVDDSYYDDIISEDQYMFDDASSFMSHDSNESEPLHEIELEISSDITQLETDKADEPFLYKKMLDDHTMSLTGKYEGSTSSNDLASTRRGSMSTYSSGIYNTLGKNSHTPKCCDDKNTISTSRSTVSSFSSRLPSSGSLDSYSKIAGVQSWMSSEEACKISGCKSSRFFTVFRELEH